MRRQPPRNLDDPVEYLAPPQNFLEPLQPIRAHTASAVGSALGPFVIRLFGAEAFADVIVERHLPCGNVTRHSLPGDCR